MEAEAPVDKAAVGDNDSVLLPLAVGLAVSLKVAEPVGVGLLEGVAEGVRQPVWEPVPDSVPVLEAEAPTVKEPVGVSEREELPLGVEDGV